MQMLTLADIRVAVLSDHGILDCHRGTERHVPGYVCQSVRTWSCPIGISE